MDITVTGPDGAVHTFPDGTTGDVIDRTLSRHYGLAPEQTAVVRGAFTPDTNRSQGRRFQTNAADGYARSLAGTMDRTADADGDGSATLGEYARGVFAAPKVREGRGVDWLLDATLGNDRTFLPGQTDAQLETAAGRLERQRRADYEAAAQADPIANPLDFASFLAGQVAGGGISPENWIGGGASAGRSVFARFALRAAEQGALAGVADVAIQQGDMVSGAQDEFSVGQTTGAVALGGLLGGATEFIPAPKAKPEVAAANAVAVAEDTFSVPLHEGDLAPSPPPALVGSLPAGSEIIRRIEGGGALPGDVWDPALNAWVHRVDGPTAEVVNAAPGGTAETPNATPGAAGSDGPHGGPRAPEEPEAASPPPTGNGAGGWSDVDWGTRSSPARAEAAVRHLESLRTWIKPEAVSDFLKQLDGGLNDAEAGDYVNMRWVDWAAFNGKPEETLGFQNAMGDIFDDVFQAAGRKAQGHAETQRLANEMGVSLSDVLKTHADITGQGGIAPRLHALRNVFNESAADARVRIGELRERVKSAMTAEDVRELAELLQRSVILGAMDNSASSEVARALNARKMQSRPAVLVDDLQDALGALNGVLDSEGGIRDSGDLGKILDDLTASYDRAGARGLHGKIRTIRAMGILDYLNYLAVGSLLSAPISHVRNLTGSPMMGMGDIAARFISSVAVAPIRQALLANAGKSARSITVHDTFAHMQGVQQSLQESFQLAGQALVKGAPIFDNVSTMMHNPRQVPYALTKARMAKWHNEGFSLSTAADIAGVALFELVRTTGFRLSVAGDELNKTLSRRAASNSFAYREAAYRAKAGQTPAEQARIYADTLKALQTEPTAEAHRAAQNAFAAGEVDRVTDYGPGSAEFQMQAILAAVDIQKASAEYARHMAFQGDGPAVRALEGFIRTVPLFRTLAANFIRTPLQLLKAAFRDYNPVTGPIILALEHVTPTGRARHAEFFRALAGEETDLTSGVNAELAIGRMAVGTMAMGAIWGYWSQGDLVGAQVPEGDEYAGVRPNSIKVPGVGWVEFTGFSPVSDLLGMVADAGHLHRSSEMTAEQSFSMMGAVGVILRQRINNLPVLTGVMDVVEAMSGKQITGDSPVAADRQMERAIAGLILPRATLFGSALKKFAQGEDPVVRDTRSWMDELRLYLPSTSATLAAKRDFMGREVMRDPGTVGLFQVFKTSGPASDPLEIVLHNLASRYNQPWEPAPLSPYLDGQEMTGVETSRLAEIQGQLYRDPRTRRNMEEELRHLITTREFLGASNQAEQLGEVISDFRRAGKAAAHNPRSPLYMREMAARLGPRRAARDARSRGLDAASAYRRRGRTYGLTSDDVPALEAALAEIN